MDIEIEHDDDNENINPMYNAEEPYAEPETCEEGEFNGIECNINWIEEGYWFCSTCNQVR